MKGNAPRNGYLLRWPPDLRAAVEAIAVRYGRSTNAQIVWALQQHVSQVNERERAARKTP